MNKFNTGDKFPDMTLELVNDGSIKLPGDISGNYHVVLFYRGHWWPFCVRQLVAFNDLLSDFQSVNTNILGASVDPIDKANEVQEKVQFPIAHGVTRAQADSMGSWWEDRRSIIQPSEFILDSNGEVVSATYSTGPIGRVMPEDALKLIRFYESRKNSD